MKKLLWLSVALILFSCDDDDSSPSATERTSDYFLDSAVVLEPNKFEISPLSVNITIDSKINHEVELRIIDDEENRIQKETFTAENKKEIVFVGLFADKSNKIEMKFSDASGNYFYDTVEVITDPLPKYLPSIEIMTNTKTSSNGWIANNFNLGRGGYFNTIPYAYDIYGNIRWFLNLESIKHELFPLEMVDGKSILLSGGNNIIEFGLNGEKLVDITTEDGWAHHDVIKLDNGNYIVAVNINTKNFTDALGETNQSVEDHIYEYNSSGQIVHEWDIMEILDVDRQDLAYQTGDWFHMNAITYDPSDNTLIVSGRNQGVIKIDWKNNLKWIIAPHRNWGKAGVDGNGFETSDYLLTAINSAGQPYETGVQDGSTNINEFEWVYGQHDPEILSNGNLLIFDNGFNRNFAGPDFAQGYSRVVEYKIDEENMTIQQVWSYGRDRGVELYSPIVSAVSELDNGNYFFAPGVTNGFQNASAVEINPLTNSVVWESKVSFKLVYAQGTLAWGELDLHYRTSVIKF